MTEVEMVGWHHRLNGHEFEQTLVDDEGQGSLACCSPWGHKELETTERLNCINYSFLMLVLCLKLLHLWLMGIHFLWLQCSFGITY